MSDLNRPGDDDLIDDGGDIESSEQRLAEQVGVPDETEEGRDGDLDLGPAIAPPD